MVSSYYHLSYEKISTFKTCPRRYFYSYLLCAQPDFTPYYLYLGKIVHSVVAYSEKTGKPFKPFLADQLLQFEFKQEDEIKKTYELSLPLISNWAEWKKTRAQDEVRAIEKPFDIFTKSGVLFRGKIDRISYNSKEDQWLITDYKTGTSKILRQKIKQDLQLNCYALALTILERGVRNIKIELVYLRDSDVRQAEISLDSVCQIEERIDNVYQTIMQNEQYPQKRGWYCKLCRFSQRCQKENIRDAHFVMLLKTLAENEDSVARENAASHLAQLNKRLAIPALTRTLLHDPARRVRKTAAYGLEKLGDEWTLSKLVRIIPVSFNEQGLLALDLIANKCFKLNKYNLTENPRSSLVLKRKKA